MHAISEEASPHRRRRTHPIIGSLSLSLSPLPFASSVLKYTRAVYGKKRPPFTLFPAQLTLKFTVCVLPFCLVTTTLAEHFAAPSALLVLCNHFLRILACTYGVLLINLCNLLLESNPRSACKHCPDFSL